MANQYTDEDYLASEVGTVEQVEEEILSTELRDEDYETVRKAVESLPYTTTFLSALELVYRKEFDDNVSADMINAFMKQFAKHEAKNI